MGLLLNLSLLVTCLCVLHGYAYEEEDETKRAMEILHLLEREPELQEDMLRAIENRKIFDCKAEGEECRGVPKCCGSLQCYWKNGYSMIKKGECVKCVQPGQKCQRDAQCCSDSICDKGNALWLDGTCSHPRAAGRCYRNKQCASGNCGKKWWQTHGACTSA